MSPGATRTAWILGHHPRTLTDAMPRFLSVLLILAFAVAGLVPAVPEACCCGGGFPLSPAACCGSAGSTCCIQPAPFPDAATADGAVHVSRLSVVAMIAAPACGTIADHTAPSPAAAGGSPPPAPTLAQLSMLRI